MDNIPTKVTRHSETTVGTAVNSCLCWIRSYVEKLKTAAMWSDNDNKKRKK